MFKMWDKKENPGFKKRIWLKMVLKPDIAWNGPVSGLLATNILEFHSIHNALQIIDI